MNKINPLYILILLFLTLAFIINKSMDLETKIVSSKIFNLNLEESGKTIQKLKQKWSNKDIIIKRIDSILSLNIFTKKIISKSIKRNNYILKIHKLNAREIDLLINKILNNYIPINSLSINKDDNKTLSIDIGIKL